jgi:hypothetical protein
MGDQLAVKVIVVVLMILIIGAVVVPRIRARIAVPRRRNSMAQVAQSQGWTHVAESEAMLPLVRRLPRSWGQIRDVVSSTLMRMEPPRLAVGSRVTNVLEGNLAGRQLRVFDWGVAQATGSGNARVSYLHTVWAIDLPQVPFWMQAASKAQTYDRWQPGQPFPTGDKEFDKRFLVTCEDPSHLQGGLTAQVRQLLLASDFDGWRLDPELSMLLVWTYSRRRFAPAERIVEMTGQAMELAAAAELGVHGGGRP